MFFRIVFITFYYFICVNKVVNSYYQTNFRECNRSDGWFCQDENKVLFDCLVSDDIRNNMYNAPDRRHWEEVMLGIWSDGTEINIYSGAAEEYRDFTYTKKNTSISTLTVANCQILRLDFIVRKNVNVIPVSKIVIKNVSSLRSNYLYYGYKFMPKIIELENVTVDYFDKEEGLTTLIATDVYTMGRSKFGKLFMQNITNLNIRSSGISVFAKLVNISESNIPSLKSKANLVVTADNFNFTGNQIGVIEKGGLKITSPNVIIADNHFEYLESGGFQEISAGIRDINFKHEVTQIYIKNNTFQHVAENGLTLNFSPTVHRFDFSVLEKNYMNCSCKNIEWFTSLKNDETSPIMEQLYNKQILENNFCLNDRNCSILKVAGNFRRLCTDKNLDYVCSTRYTEIDSYSDEVFYQMKTNEILIQILKNQERSNLQSIELTKNLTDMQSYLGNSMKNNEKQNSQLITLQRNFFNDIINYLRFNKEGKEFLSSSTDDRNTFQPSKGLDATRSWHDYPPESYFHSEGSDASSRTQENSISIVLLPNWFLIFSVVLLGVTFSFFIYKKWRSRRLLSNFPRRDSIGLEESVCA